ncbi:MAG: hypothetical protein ABI863_00480 [Ginsengibacter sp.]
MTVSKIYNAMPRYIISLILFSSLLTSCDKNYKYVEVVQEESILGETETKEKESKPIKAADDSTAYLEAYQDFCISLKVNKDMKASLGKTYSTPKSFKLYNDKGLEIATSVVFGDKDKREKEIEERIFSMENAVQKSVDKMQKMQK